MRTSHPYHLYDDVRNQPDIMEKTLQLKDRLEAIAGEIVKRNPQRILFVGCGSAFYTSQLAAYLTEELTAFFGQAAEGWEYVCHPKGSSQDTVLIAQSATGGSFEVLKAVTSARSKGMTTFAITNTAGSPLQSTADETIVVPAPQKTGPDIAVITARLMALYLLIFYLARHKPHPEIRHDWDTLEERLQSQPSLARKLLSERELLVSQMADRYYHQQAILVVGSGVNWFTAQEAALKIEEESATPCRCYLTGDFHHMAISLLSKDRPTLVFAPVGDGYDRTLTCLRTARAAGSPAIAIVCDGDESAGKYADDVFPLPGAKDPILFPILGTIFSQLYGYHLALRKGRNPDCLSTDDMAHTEAWLISFPLGSH